jgi:hypothetical protein
MRRTLCVLSILVFALSVGYTQQPPPHVGEWDAEWFTVGKDVPMAICTFYFSADVKVQMISVTPHAAPYVREGKRG